jgi:hypothetical protein
VDAIITDVSSVVAKGKMCLWMDRQHLTGIHSLCAKNAQEHIFFSCSPNSVLYLNSFLLSDVRIVTDFALGQFHAQ